MIGARSMVGVSSRSGASPRADSVVVLQGLLAIGFEKYGSEDELQRDAIMHLFHVYVSINKDVKAEEAENRSDTKDRAKDYFKHLEDGWSL